MTFGIDDNECALRWVGLSGDQVALAVNVGYYVSLADGNTLARNEAGEYYCEAPRYEIDPFRHNVLCAPMLHVLTALKAVGLKVRIHKTRDNDPRVSSFVLPGSPNIPYNAGRGSRFAPLLIPMTNEQAAAFPEQLDKVRLLSKLRSVEPMATFAKAVFVEVR